MGTPDITTSSSLGVPKETNVKVYRKLCTMDILLGVALGFFVCIFTSALLMLKTPKWACHSADDDQMEDTRNTRVNNARIGLCSVSLGSLAFLGYMLWVSSK